jgi:hypothetical protein
MLNEAATNAAEVVKQHTEITDVITNATDISGRFLSLLSMFCLKHFSIWDVYMVK